MDDFNTQAHRLLQAGQKQQARELLEATLRAMPPGWKPIQDGQGPSVRAAFWNQEEFFAYFHGSPKPTRSTSWVPGSYSRAWLQLAEMACDDHNFALALEYISYGVDLESDHPDLWNFRGYVLGKMKHFEESLAAYEHAATCRSWAPASQVARALRGKGYAWLTSIASMRPKPRCAARSTWHQAIPLPWASWTTLLKPATKRSGICPGSPAPCFTLPQTNGHARRLLSPKTCPPAPGPRSDDPRYWQVKQDLLCEPVLNAKVHREMTSIITGEVPIEEMMARLKARFCANPK